MTQEDSVRILVIQLSGRFTYKTETNEVSFNGKDYQVGDLITHCGVYMILHILHCPEGEKYEQVVLYLRPATSEEKENNK